MTVPTLMQNYQRKSYVTQLHKIYNQLSQATLQYVTDKNAINLQEAGLNNANEIDAFMKKYFKIVQDCSNDISACAASSDYKKMDGTAYPLFYDNGYGFKYYILANGSLIGLLNYDTNKIQVNLDINGKQGPNIVGRDTFAFNIYKSNGLIDDDCGSAPCTEEERETTFENQCISSTTSGWFGCFGKILNDNWEMTY